MEKVILAPELESFLKKKRVLRKFIKNCNKAIGEISNIKEGFVWEYSLEKHLYWSTLDQKFEKGKRIKKEKEDEKV